MTISTTAAEIGMMIPAIFGFLAILCIMLGTTTHKKRNKTDHKEEDRPVENPILNEQVRMILVQADRYNNLAYLMFRILYELIGEPHPHVAIRTFAVLRGAHARLDSDAQEDVQLTMKSIRTDDPDLEMVMEYILNLMEVPGVLNSLSVLGREDYYEVSRNLAELQQTLQELEKRSN